MPVCRECDCNITSHKPNVKCSGCDLDIHLECIGLSKEEATCFTRSKVKNFKVFCSRCNEQEGKLEQLIKTLEARDRKIEELSLKLDNICTTFQNRLTSLEDNMASVQRTLNGELREQILREATDRVSRMNNVIVTQLPETSAADDLNAAKEIVKLTSEFNLESLQVSRLGPRTNVNNGRTRPLKVCIGNPDIVKMVLRRKNKLLGTAYNRVKIYDDRTEDQREFLEAKRQELKTRIDNGEKDITIKYVKGVPTIVSLPTSKK